MSVQACSQPRCERDPGGEGAIELLIRSRAKDLGDFEVRRVLPASERQRIGPFIFFDHMGPARFAPGRGIDVRPHPHIGLATVTYLFEGAIQHRDSLGSDQRITPGAVNWMTAGRGIVHSERTPPDLRAQGATLHGLQIWLALPLEAEETEPDFVHHPESALPRLAPPGARIALVLGEAWGERSPVATASPSFYAAVELEPGGGLALPDAAPERGVYLLEGEASLAGAALEPGTLAVVRPGVEPVLAATRRSRLAMIGGEPLTGERHLWWNFVSSSSERLERAKRDWREGRFPSVPDDPEFIPLPEG